MHSYQIEFIPITDAESKGFSTAMHIYSGAFPLNERQPLSLLKHRVSNGLNQLYAGHVEGKIVFIALLWPLRNTNFILLEYMATSEAYRGKKIGAYFLQTMRKVLEEEKKYFIIEAEDPAYGDNKSERQRRLAFYKRNGARELRGVKFILPAIQGTTSTEMKLLVFPGYDPGKIDAMLVKGLILQIYREVYNYAAATDLFASSPYYPGGRIELD